LLRRFSRRCLRYPSPCTRRSRDLAPLSTLLSGALSNFSLEMFCWLWHWANRRSCDHASREKAGGRYTVGFFLRLPARFPVPSRLRSDCNEMVNERLTDIVTLMRCARRRDGPSAGELRPKSSGRNRAAYRHHSEVGSHSADPIKFCFRNHERMACTTRVCSEQQRIRFEA
jgi:hypothetical protein